MNGQDEWRPSHNPWLVAVVVSVPAFMEVLDTSIANVALPYIAGGLGSSLDESTWVLTTYLVSNAVVLPVSGWFVRVLGRKRFFVSCIFLFTASSFLCGTAPSLGLLLLFRVIQGTGGGGLQPMAQAILADAFPPEKRGLAFSVYGITAVIAPIVGPTLGGWLTDNYSWHWIFLVNVPVGVLALLLVFRLLEEPPHAARVQGGGIRLDYIGFALLVLGVGALQVVLDRGQQDDWFGSQRITILAIVSAVCLMALLVWEWRRKEPLIDVHLFKNFNFLSSNVMMFMLGVVLFSSIVMMPRFLQTRMGYTAYDAGLVLSMGGLALLVQMPIVGKLTGIIQARFLIAVGWAAVAASMAYTAMNIDLEISFAAARWISIVQRLGLPFLFVPITLVAYVGLAPEKYNNAAGLINFMRNIGSSVGTSFVTTMLARRAQFHQVHLVPHVAVDNPTFVDQLDGLAGELAREGLGAYEGRRQALARIYAEVQAQADTLAYLDTFWLVAAAAVLMFALSFLLRRNDPRAGAPAAH